MQTQKRKFPWWIIYVLIVGFFIVSRLFWWSIIKVDGHSMDPTLNNNEYMIMFKNTTIERGSIVVATESDGKTIIKRVIGLPGDVVTYNNDSLTINGEPVNETYLADYKEQLKNKTLAKTYANYATDTTTNATSKEYFVKQAETLTNFTVDSNGQSSFSVKVPEGTYYLMGDNRAISADSRKVGAIPADQIEGVIRLGLNPFQIYQ